MNFSAKQKEILQHGLNEDVFCASYGAIRSGKTYASALAFLIYTQSRAPKGARHLVAGRNLRTMKREIIPTLETFCDAAGTPHHYEYVDNTFHAGGHEYLLTAANDAKAEARIRGLTIHSILLDEATLVPQDFFEAMVGRMTYGESKGWLTFNPGHPYHWLKTDWIDTDGIERCVHCVMADNPSLPAKVIARNESLFDGVFKRRMIDGVWAAAEGAIYPSWQECRTPREADVRWRDIGLDYGISTVTAFVQLATLHNGQQVIDKCWSYDGRKSNPLTDGQIADALQAFAGDRVRTVYIDPSAASLHKELLRIKGRRFRVQFGRNEVIPGIRTCMNLLERGELKICDHPSTMGLRREMAEYSWEIGKEDRPVKANDHLCDALRYVAFSLNWLRRSAGGKIALPEGL